MEAREKRTGTFLADMQLVQAHLDKLQRECGQPVRVIRARPTRCGWAVSYRMGEDGTEQAIALNTSSGAMCAVPVEWVTGPEPEQCAAVAPPPGHFA